MVVVVGDGGVEDDPPEKLQAISVRLIRPAAQFIGQQGIGPAFPVHMAILAVEHGESADKTEAKIASLRALAVESFNHEYIMTRHRLKACVTDGDAAATSKLKGGVFHPLEVAAVALFRELAEPEAIAVLDRGLGPCAAHGRAGFELLENVNG